MSTDRDFTRVLRSWLDEGVNVLPDRVLDLVLDQLPATSQRRAGWLAWRFPFMSNVLKIAAAVVAVALIAVLGISLLPGTGVGGPSATATPVPTIQQTPSPSPAPLARGTFTATVGGGYSVDLDATGGASSVAGSMIVVSQETNRGYTVDLECTRTIDGLLWIGGDVTESTFSDAPADTRAAIVFERGSPVKAIFVWQGSDPRSASCQAFFDDMIAIGVAGDLRAGMEPIEGTLELGP